MKKKKLISFFTVAVFCFLLIGCFGSNTAENSAEIYCSLIFKSDTVDYQEIGISDSEKDLFVSQYEDEIKNQLKHNLISMGYSASDDQLNSICAGYKVALSKVTYDVKQISKSGNEAEVEISTNHFDARGIDEKVAMDALDETENMEFASDDEESKKYIEIYLNKLAEGLKNAEVSSKKSENTFKFKKADKYWEADDLESFGYKLVQLATNNENPNLNINETRISPEESAKIFWDLIIKADSSGMNKIGYSEAFGKRIIRTMNKNELETFKKEFNQAGVSFSDDQIRGMIDALRGTISKNSVNFEQVSKTDTTAEVKVSSASIEFNSIVNNAVDKTTSQSVSRGMTDNQKILDLYCTNLIYTIKNAQQGSTKNERTFSFTKISDVWMPVDVKSFAESIGKMNMQ